MMSPAVKRHLQVAGASLTSRFPSAATPLARPPRDSTLDPVMGNYGFPFLGHILSSFVEPLEFARQRYDKYGPVSWAGGVGFRIVALMGPEPWRRCGSTGTRRSPAARLGTGHRAVLPPRHHAARLQRAPRPPPHHAAGIHPHRPGRLPRADAARASPATWPNCRLGQHFPCYPSVKRLLLAPGRRGVRRRRRSAPRPTGCRRTSTTPSAAARP